jgi:hypothetical protein
MYGRTPATVNGNPPHPVTAVIEECSHSGADQMPVPTFASAHGK